MTESVETDAFMMELASAATLDRIVAVLLRRLLHVVPVIRLDEFQHYGYGDEDAGHLLRGRSPWLRRVNSAKHIQQTDPGKPEESSIQAYDHEATIAAMRPTSSINSGRRTGSKKRRQQEKSGEGKWQENEPAIAVQQNKDAKHQKKHSSNAEQNANEAANRRSQGFG